MKKISLLFMISFLLNACSFSSAPKEQAVTQPQDELEFAVDAIAETPPADLKVEEQKIEEIKIPDEVSSEKSNEMNIVAGAEEGKEQAIAPLEEPQIKDYIKKEEPEIRPLVTESTELGKEMQYHVEKGDTLMMVGFKIYGDYRKWKDLKEWNKEKLKSNIRTGMVLKYYEPNQNFGWQPSGLPYMVKTGDTLQLVSMDKYGTTRKWKAIYENNRPLIRNPNAIFAGFTLYYVPVRDIASEHK